MPSLNMDVVREQFSSEHLKHLRPWSEFAARDGFSRPTDFVEVQRRMNCNIPHFKSNYLLIFLAVTVYCLLTNLMLLVAGVVIGVAYKYLADLPVDYTLLVAGQSFTKNNLFIIWIGVSLFLLWLASAGGTLFWLMGVAAVIIGSHAALHEPTVQSDFASPA